MARQVLLIDADDTLWENNVFFEKTIEHFVTQLETLGYTREYIRHILNETERRNIRQHGYGVRSFRRSLEDTYLKLAGNSARRSAATTARAALARVSFEASSPYPAHQRRGRRTSRQSRTLRPSALFRRHRNRPRKGNGHVSSPGRAAQNRQDARLDGGQQPTQRHQSCAPGRPQCSLHSSFRHLGAGKNGTRKRHRKTSDPRHFSRTSLALLKSNGFGDMPAEI